MFETKKEKYAYVQGLRAGARGKKPFPRKEQEQSRKYSRKPAKKPWKPTLGNSFDTDDFFQAALAKTFRDMDKSTGSPKKRKQYTDDFERTSTGRIKGSYTVDGFFEPD